MTTNDETVSGPFGPLEGARPSAREAIQDMLDAGLLDDLMGRIDDGDLQLTGDGGFIPEMIKAVLERGLGAELTSHLGYRKGDPAGRVLPNSRNGTTPKTVHSEVGSIPLDIPRDRHSTFEPRLVPKGERQVGGLADMIISLYAGGMTIRDIQAQSLSSCLCVSGSVHFQLMWLSSRSGKAMRRAPRAAFQPWVVAPSTR